MLDEAKLKASLDGKVKKNNECDMKRNRCNMNRAGLE